MNIDLEESDISKSLHVINNNLRLLLKYYGNKYTNNIIIKYKLEDIGFKKIF
jgi:hypothetical protein